MLDRDQSPGLSARSWPMMACSQTLAMESAYDAVRANSPGTGGVNSPRRCVEQVQGDWDGQARRGGRYHKE